MNLLPARPTPILARLGATAANIRAALGSVPFSGAIIHLVPALPRNDMGKIDRIVLRQSIAAALAQAQSTAKRT